MAMAEQIKSLVKAHVEHDNEKFKTVVLQIAAHEAKLGHDKIARDLKTLIDKIGMKPGNILQLNSKNPMLELSISSHSLSELIVNDDIYDKSLELYFHARIREERKFASMDDLKKQIEADKKRIREYFADIK